ncbi:peptidoglycan-binding protein [Aliihoeflea sp. PC F10.4]
MNTKQAYLDALNTGRRRRPSTSIEDLNRTLADLETRIAQRSEPDAGAAPARLAAEIETQRQNEESIEAAGSIASELKLLRDDLNAKIADGIEREFAVVKSQIEDARAEPAACKADELSGEVERLSGMIDALAARGSEDNAARLQAEMETIRQTLAELARETTLQSVERRLDAFTGTEPELMTAIQSRLEEISVAVGSLPEQAAMHALDEKLKILAAAMDRFAQNEGPLGDGALTLIDERLDEISRAIASSASAGRGLIVDGKPFERIEARIGSLARQIEELVEDRPTADIGEQIAAMSKRIDEMAAREAMPFETITRLAEQMSLIAGKVDAISPSPDLSEIFDGVEKRFAAFSQIMDERNETAATGSAQLFAELDQRLTVLTERLEAVQANQSTDALMAAMDERFASFADTFETRLDGISKRLETTTATLAAIDPDLVRSLEAQVKTLSETIQTPSHAGSEFEDVAPRLERLEQMIADNHAAVLDAARSAAEEAVRSIGSTPTRDNDVVQGLADDLRALESLARRSDERNTKTFEAIHDTLLKIVERLGAMEPDDTDEEPARLGIASAPAMHTNVDDLALDAHASEDDSADAPSVTPEPLTPREAAHQAVRATKAGRSEETLATRSMIARVLGRKTKDKSENAAPNQATAIAPTLDLDAPIDPALANQPIEPGLGSPDLNAIMRRVRDEREMPARDTPSGDDAKADFIAAARRAAQAAAAEAESLKAGRTGEGSQRFSLSKLLKSKNRALTMGIVAVALALTGLQINRSQTVEEAVASVEPAATQPVAVARIDETQTAALPEPVVTAKHETARNAERAVPTPAAPSATVSASPPSQARAATVAGPTIAAARANEPAVDVADPLADETAAIPEIPQQVNAALRTAAEAGDPKAFFEIGNRYAEGRGVTEDLNAAAQWYESAASAGLAPAQYRLANMLEKANGVERDLPRAMDLYAAAAAKGNANAMHNLAVLQAMGADGRADNAAAARNFGKAAELGIRDSQFNLAILAAKGVGMSQDLVTAYKWLAIVADAGDTDAAAKRDEIAALLSEADLEKAKKTVELWKPKTTSAEANAVSIPAEWGEDTQTTASIDMEDAVRQIQAMLNAKGYDVGQPDGIIGARTVSAISAFQTDNQMQPTGQIDEPLVRALLAVS